MPQPLLLLLLLLLLLAGGLAAYGRYEACVARALNACPEAMDGYACTRWVTEPWQHAPLPGRQQDQVACCPEAEVPDVCLQSLNPDNGLPEALILACWTRWPNAMLAQGHDCRRYGLARAYLSAHYGPHLCEWRCAPENCQQGSATLADNLPEAERLFYLNACCK